MRPQKRTHEDQAGERDGVGEGQEFAFNSRALVLEMPPPNSKWFRQFNPLGGFKTMRYIRAAVAVAMVAASMAVMGCNYGGVTVAGDKAVVLRNDALLMGMLRKAYVCKVSEAGLANCNTADSP